MRSIFLACFLLLPFLRLLYAPVEAGALIQVNTVADELDSGGDCSLREAVLSANADASIGGCPAGSGTDVILLPEGVYLLTIPGNDEAAAQTGDLDITADLTLTGTGAGTTIIDANQLDRVFEIVAPAVVTLSGVSLRNGNPGVANGRPGAVFDGGGVAVHIGAQLSLHNSVVDSNVTAAGQWAGGILNAGSLMMDHSTVSGNHAAYVGGIRNSGTLVAFDSAITGNSATYYAGGIFSTGVLTLTRVTISANQGGTSGGGLYQTMGRADLTNVTFSGNTTGNYGGGIWVYYQAELYLVNSTISGNHATAGGGIYHMHPALNSPAAPSGPQQEGDIHLLNTIIAGNTASDCLRNYTAPPPVSLGYNLDSDGTCELGAVGDLPHTNPLLGPLQNNGGPTQTFALLSGSPAIDAGDNAGCSAVDQRGVTRPVDGDGDGSAICDIGSFEYDATGPALHWLYLPFIDR